MRGPTCVRGVLCAVATNLTVCAWQSNPPTTHSNQRTTADLHQVENTLIEHSSGLDCRPRKPVHSYHSVSQKTQVAHCIRGRSVETPGYQSNKDVWFIHEATKLTTVLRHSRPTSVLFVTYSAQEWSISVTLCASRTPRITSYNVVFESPRRKHWSDMVQSSQVAPMLPPTWADDGRSPLWTSCLTLYLVRNFDEFAFALHIAANRPFVRTTRIHRLERLT